MAADSYVIGIAGPSGAGKSFLARNLTRDLNAHVLSIDAYYRDLGHLDLHEREHSNFDDPAALDHTLLIEHISALRRGEAADIPVYDFATHTRQSQTRHFGPAPVVIVEGLFTLHWPELRELLGTKVYVDLHDELCLERRKTRDVRERGRTPESVIRQYLMMVAPMAEKYVRPSMAHADVVVFGGDRIDRSIRAVVEHVRQHVPEQRVLNHAGRCHP